MSLNELFEIFFARKDYKRAIRTAQAMDEPSRTKKLSEIIDVYLSQKPLTLKDVTEIAKVMKEPERSKYLRKIAYEWNKRGWVDEAINTLMLVADVKERNEGLEEILTEEIEAGDLESCQKIVGGLKRELRREELERILKKKIEECNLEEAEKIVSIIGREFDGEEIRVMFERTLELAKKHPDTVVARASGKITSYIDEAVEIAEMLPVPQKEEALQEVIKVAVEMGEIKAAQAIAKLLPEKIRKKYEYILE